MGFMMDQEYNPLAAMVHRALAHKERSLSASHKQAEIAGAKETGILDGLADGVAAILNLERMDRYGSLFEGSRFLPMVEHWDTGKILRDGRRLYAEAEEKEEKDAIFSSVFNEIRALVQNDGLDELLENQRRQKILLGETEPTEKDLEWLTQEREKLSAVVNPYEEAINKIQVKS